MKKITLTKSLTCFIALFCAVNFGFGQIITFDFASLDGNEISTNSNYNDPYLGVSTITRGIGLTPDANNDRFNAVNWAGNNIIDAINQDDYMEFTISPNTGYIFNITTITVNFQRSGTGPNTIALRNSIDGYATTIDGEKRITVSGTTTQVITFTINQPTLENNVTYRIYGSASSNLGTGGFEGSGDDIIVNGTVNSLGTCLSVTNWDGTSWDNGDPDIDKVAILNASYNTATSSIGSFSACSLTINNGATLTIGDNDYVEVQNDLIVDVGGTINVQPYGAFIQNDDSGVATNNGTISVSKDTAPLDNWYEYTYWSSPVSNATVGVALADSDSDRRFIFNASLFNDESAETNNDNNLVFGIQDDIDDEGDDWERIDGTTVMQPGIGYAATHSEAAFFIPPGPFTPPQFRYTFEGGTFNNGIITVPVYRNDITTADFNWNLIGNPYPSAIDIAAFMTQNRYDTATNTSGPLEGAIYFWSQKTNYSATANGNQGLNFDTTDYATHNGTGGTVGGDGLTPNGFIPSGQAFFVTFSDNHSGNTGNVIFNNAMRSISLSPDNSQFFKNSSSKKKNNSNSNKLWLNLTSDNGVFNQILIGYINGATNNDDGSYYDANKIVAPNVYASLYSTIENSNKKFSIQGKAVNSLDENEIIKLGFKTTINVATLYKISVSQLQGDFLTSNTIYLKDNLTGTVHDLSASDYTFTSEIGEFNERFEIAFTNKALSTENHTLDTKQLKIVQLDNDNVQFSTTDNLSIKSVRIFDLLGRQLYNLKGNSSSETFKLSNLNKAIYIAKVELSNGTIITKKSIKN